ncbi:GTP-binding protein HSR1 [candidate division KSB1 bacterium]|nr:MAG: GTP-binding protein HSR1 [candidate division KSB1 bacterium]
MPANLPPDYYAAERKLKETSDPEEKVKILKNMLSIMPKHKGTEHLRGQLRRKIKKLQSDSQKKNISGRSGIFDYIPKEGAGQVVIAGFPNSGKSTLFTNLTNARSTIAEFPFSTFSPIPGMMKYEDIQIQVIDLPPVSEEHIDRVVINIVRLADLVLIICDLSDVVWRDKLKRVLSVFQERKIIFKKEGVSNPITSTAVKSTVIFGNKIDNATEQNKSLPGEIDIDIPFITGSALKAININTLKSALFEGLHIIRVYTKTPGYKPDMDSPYILKKGATVHSLAAVIHKDIETRMKYARIWGCNNYAGQRVEREHILCDKDIVEIHTR